MTLKEIMELSLRLMMEDVDDDTLAEYGPLLKSVINDAYMDICRFKYVPTKSENITLSDGAFNISELSETLNEIIKIEYDDKELPFNIEDGVCSVFLLRDETVFVKYSYLPPALSVDTDVPIIPEEFHTALADYAVFRMLSTGSSARQTRAMFFFDIYVRKANKIERMDKSGTIKNKYE